MNSELLLFHEKILRCNSSEDLFGILDGDKEAQLKSRYRKFALISHSDRYSQVDEKRIADIAFAKLGDLHRLALARVAAKTYGTAKKEFEKIILKSRKNLIIIKGILAGGDLSSVFYGDSKNNKTNIEAEIIVKISKHQSFNDLLENEAATLTKLNIAAANTVSYKQFIPALIESLKANIGGTSDIRQVNIFESRKDYHSLEELNSYYPKGVDSRHFVWIFNRLLTTLSFAHSQGIVHGAILPPHVLVHPINHSIQLIDWCFSCEVGKNIVATSKNYASFYPIEIIGKKPATSATDIYMSAMNMCYILGGNFGELPIEVPLKIRRFLESCLIKNQSRRPQSAWDLYKELQVVSEEVFGKRRYVKLELT